jgi:integrase
MHEIQASAIDPVVNGQESPAKAQKKRRPRARRGRGEGAIFQRESDGLWVGSVSLGLDEKGKRRRRVVYGATKKEVQEEVRKLQHDASNGKLADAGSLTVSEYLKLWLQNDAKPRVAPKTHLRYEQLVRLRINPVIGGTRLAKLAPVHLKQLLATLDRDGVSPRGRQMTATMLHTALRDAVRDKLITSNPASDVSKPRPVTKAMRIFDTAQVAKFLDAAKADRLAALYTIALDAGMRQGELFGLRWVDIDFGTGSLLVQHSLEEINGSLRLKQPKSGKGRRIELTKIGLESLNEHRKAMLAEGHYRPDAPVFCDTEGGWLRKGNVLRRSYWPIIDKANKDEVELAEKQKREPAPLPRIRFHDLRHSMASLLLLAGVNPKVVQERLGHAKIQVTLDTYSHVLPTIQKEAAERMNAILGAIS